MVLVAIIISNGGVVCGSFGGSGSSTGGDVRGRT